MSAEFAIVYAALILQDDGIEITVSIEFYEWAIAKFLSIGITKFFSP
jgi:hypothetical protein